MGIIFIPGGKIEKRFKAKIDVQGECWVWIGYINSKGYGRFAVSAKENYAAHRVSYMNYVDPNLPPYPEITLNHICENRACVRPEHLEPMSIKQNARAGSKSNYQKDFCPQGHFYGPDNTYVDPTTGQRTCRICRRENLRASRARRKG